MKDLLRTFLRVIGSLETGAEPVSSAMCAFSDMRYENYLPQLMFTASTMILFITAVKKEKYWVGQAVQSCSCPQVRSSSWCGDLNLQLEQAPVGASGHCCPTWRHARVWGVSQRSLLPSSGDKVTPQPGVKLRGLTGDQRWKSVYEIYYDLRSILWNTAYLWWFDMYLKSWFYLMETDFFSVMSTFMSLNICTTLHLFCLCSSYSRIRRKRLFYWEFYF